MDLSPTNPVKVFQIFRPTIRSRPGSAAQPAKKTPAQLLEALHSCQLQVIARKQHVAVGTTEWYSLDNLDEALSDTIADFTPTP